MRVDPVQLLRKRFGYPAFRSGQEALVRAALNGRDALGVLPTGGGKSVCYQIPAMILDGLTLVITPLVSLMEDQVGRARRVGLRAANLSGTQTPGVRAEIVSQARHGRLDVLFVSPERLDVPTFRGLLDDIDVALLAVDEAHCISEWGHDFRPAYRRIGRLTGALRSPTLALTATATPEVRRDIIESLRLRDGLEVVQSFARGNLRWGVVRAGSLQQRLGRAYATLSASPGAAIVYAPTRRSVEIVRDRLASRGFTCEAYHAGLSGTERTGVQDRFMTGRSRVVVATNAFGMGIDKADVRTVLHLQLPPSLEAYYQEAGRAGRDGQPSNCIAFHGKGDRALADGFIDRTHPPRRDLLRVHRRLRSICAPRGVVHLGDSRLLELLGEAREAWIAGEPVGPVAALERLGAVRRMGWAEPGTAKRSPVSDNRRIGVLPDVDFRSASRARRRARAKLCAVERYARGHSCRSRALLRYFGEIVRSSCGFCDRCGWQPGSE